MTLRRIDSLNRCFSSTPLEGALRHRSSLEKNVLMKQNYVKENRPIETGLLRNDDNLQHLQAADDDRGDLSGVFFADRARKALLEKGYRSAEPSLPGVVAWPLDRV
jgi:hypothetical protein